MINHTHLLVLLLMLSAACTQQTTTEQEEKETEEDTSSPMMLTSIVTTDLDTAMVEPIDSVEDEDELPRELIIASEKGTYHFALIPDKEQDGKAQYLVRRFRNLPDVQSEQGKEGLQLELPRDNAKPLRFKIPRALIK